MEQFEFENKRKRKLKKTPLLILLGCILSLVLGGVGGYLIRGDQIPEINQNNIYNEVLDYINEVFYDTSESEYSLQQRILAGMLVGLGDPHSSFLTYEEMNDLTSSINGSFEGIGITFNVVEAGGLVREVFKGSPADQSGMLAGDFITHVEGTSIAGYDSDHIKNLILGEAGTKLTMDILRNGKKHTLTIQRGSIESSVSSEIRTLNNQKIGYLRITTFGSTTANLVENVLQSFENENIHIICIDLRDNSGGYLDAARDLLDLFIPEEQVMYQIENKNGVVKYSATDRKKYEFDRGYIIFNGSTASAAEIMASGLNEVLDYQTIGVKTYGKGTVQTQLTLSDQSAIKLTTARWLTSQGKWIHREGIVPVHEVKNIELTDYYSQPLEKDYQYDQVDVQIGRMQKILKLLGYSVDRTDGYFSKKTKEALQDFEKDYGLTQNGIYEKSDLTYLLNALTYYMYQKAPDAQYQAIEKLIH